MQNQTSGAKQIAEELKIWIENDKKHTSAAKATAHFADFVPGINPRPTARAGFSASCEVGPDARQSATAGPRHGGQAYAYACPLIAVRLR